MKKYLSLLSSAVLFSLTSCTDDMREMETGQPQLLKQIVMTTQNFESESNSRTLYEIADGAVNCTWAANDTVGVFPDKGAQAYFPMYSGAGTKNATFDGEGWALKDGRTYGAYYPCIGEFYLDRHAVPVNYMGQTQVGDGTTDHLGAYDYMVATPAVPEFGSAKFMFKHLSALVQLRLTVPQPSTLTSVKLVADSEAFAVDGKVDIMADAPSITPVNHAQEVELVLQDVSTSKANQVVTLYMMLPPVDLSEQELKVEIATNKGVKEVKFEGKNFQAGTAYGFSGELKSIAGSYKNGVVSLSEAGSMKQLLGDDYLNITSLKVVGPINGDDVRCLRQMIGSRDFNNDEKGNLITLDLSEASIVEGGGWYYEYSSAKHYYTSNDVIGDYMFVDCYRLKNIVLPDNAISIGNNTFRLCNALMSIEIPNNVTSIGTSAFSGCFNLTSVTIGDGVISIGNSAFNDCDALTSITIGKNVTSVGDGAFYGCDVLTSITMGENVNSIGTSAFYACNVLSFVYITNIAAWCNIEFNTGSSNPLYYGAKLYVNNKELTELVISSDVTQIKDFAFDGYESLTKVTIGDGVTSIGRYAFRNCDALTFVMIGKDITSIGAFAFDDCDALTSIIIGDGVTSIGWNAFYDCDALSSVTIGKNVTSIKEETFYDCDALTSIIIGDGVTSIAEKAFGGCNALTSVYITNLSAWCNIEFDDVSSNPLCYGAKLYLDNEELTELVIPSDVKRIKRFTFNGCGSIVKVTTGNNITSIGSYAFKGCDALTSIAIGSSVTSIGSYAFEDCDALPSITIGENVTSIGSCAFGYCDVLSSVTIGENVTSIGKDAFLDCKAVSQYYCYATQPPTIDTSFGYRYFSQTPLYVPVGCVSKYSSSDWGNYFTNIKKME